MKLLAQFPLHDLCSVLADHFTFLRRLPEAYQSSIPSGFHSGGVQRQGGVSSPPTVYKSRKGNYCNVPMGIPKIPPPPSGQSSKTRGTWHGRDAQECRRNTRHTTTPLNAISIHRHKLKLASRHTTAVRFWPFPIRKGVLPGPNGKQRCPL